MACLAALLALNLQTEGGAPFAATAVAAGLSGQAGSFKVVRPPARNARKRITIHDPKTVVAPSRRAARHDWFWETASTEIAAAASARLAPLSELAAARLNSPAQKERLDRIAADYGGAIAAASAKARVSDALLLAVVAAESGGDPKAVSRAGAQGLAQLMPATAQRFSVDDPFDPAENLRGSAEYLSFLLQLFNEDAVLALAGYNAGENAVLRAKGVPNYAETRDYVPIVLSYYHLARGRCGEKAASARAVCAAPEG